MVIDETWRSEGGGSGGGAGSEKALGQVESGRCGVN